MTIGCLQSVPGVKDVQGCEAQVADALGVHVLDSLEDLLDQPGDLDLGDVLVGGDHVKELAAGGKLADQGQVWSLT